MVKFKSRRWIALGATPTVAFILWLTLTFNAAVRKLIWSATAYTFKAIPGSVLLMAAGIAMILAVGLYFYIDYKQHLHDHKNDDAEVNYRAIKHAKVAVLPRVLQNWEKAVYWLLHGVASVLLLSLLISFNVKPAYAYSPTDFVTTWRIDNAGDTLNLWLANYSTYTIDWGDGNITNEGDGYQHQYDAAGDYTVIISGDPFDFTAQGGKILTVEQWGGNPWTTTKEMFKDAVNLQITATDSPDLSNVTDMSYMFSGATSFNSNINSWDVSNVTTMEEMFSGAKAFNQPLNSWNVSNVTNMFGMFSKALAFDQDLNSWDVSSVTNMSAMFGYATLPNGPFIPDMAFNGNISSWNVSNVTDMSRMFMGAYLFNQPIGSWNVSNVTDMSLMFDGSLAFNQPIGSWNVSNVTDMSRMFSGAQAFNQSLNAWNVSNVTNMSGMFGGAHIFNQPLNAWDTSSVTTMDLMFSQAYLFNQPIGSWNVSNVTNMSGMFEFAKAFNQPLNSWNVSNVTNMSGMFGNTDTFNQPLGSWDVSSVTTMGEMFSKAKAFNQPLNSWNVSNVTQMYGMFRGAMAFDQDLNNWNVSNVTNMSAMFGNYDVLTDLPGGMAFNGNISSWNVSNVTDMSRMFMGAINFNQPLNSWNVSSVTEMWTMFLYAKTFNQPLDNWNTSQVTNMSGMFTGAAAFDQSLGNWNVSNVTDMSAMFGDAGGLLPVSSGLSPSNYDVTLAGWSNQSLQNGVVFSGGTSTYCKGETIRQILIDMYGWTIIDGGFECAPEEAPSNLEPFVSLVAPADGDNYAPEETVEMTAEANDEDGSIASVRFYVDGFLVGTDDTEPYQLQKQDGFLIGEHDAMAIAVDNEGAESTSEHITFTVGDEPDINEITSVNDNTRLEEIVNRVVNNQQDPRYSNNVTYYTLTGPAVITLQSIPWILLLLLALFYLYQAYRQYRQNQLIQAQLRIYEQTLASLEGFLSIISHYLRTPVTIMAGAAELIAGKGRGSEATTITTLNSTIKLLQTYIGTLLEKLTSQTQAVKQEAVGAEHIQSYSLKYWVIAPSVVAVILMSIAVLGLSRIGFWQAGLDRIIFGFTLTTGSIFGTFFFFKLWQKQRQLHQNLLTASRVAEASLAVRQSIILDSQATLVQYENDLASLSGSINRPTFQKPFTSGFNQLKKIVDTFGIVEQVTTQPITGETVSVGTDILTNDLAPLQQQANAKGVSLTLTIPASVASLASANELQFVLHSLVDNALTFTPAGGQVDVIIDHAKQGDVTMMVTDTGAGIPQDKLDTLMQPFSRGTDTGIYNYQGIGLSLYVCRLIAERYGGTVTLASEVGKGTTVTFMVKSKRL